MRGLFVTGTDTAAGKTVLAACVTAALRARGEPVLALKPVITGMDEPPDSRWPYDHEVLAGASGARPEDVALVGYGPAVSPHLAAELAGRELDPDALVRTIVARGADDVTLIVEGAGGLLVPLSGTYDMRALAVDLGLPILIAARSGLGTINHTLLTLEAARRGGLEAAGVVLTPWPAQPSVMEESNRATIAALGDIDVSVLPRIDGPDPAILAGAGAALPLECWLPLPVTR